MGLDSTFRENCQELLNSREQELILQKQMQNFHIVDLERNLNFVEIFAVLLVSGLALLSTLMNVKQNMSKVLPCITLVIPVKSHFEVCVVVNWGSGAGATFVPPNNVVTPTEVELGCVGL